MKSRKGTIAAIAAAVAAYMEEEQNALRPAVPQRKPVMVSSSWGSYGNEEMMRILWQRGIVPRVMTFGCILS
ncbi:MAG: hypothetical protein HXY36_05855 [Chloroflexi bacterium]|nr:hypothetical protein [Chloroflexota bacterium]